jgi:hypothetical protein
MSRIKKILMAIDFSAYSVKMFRHCPVPLLSIRERDIQMGGEALVRPLYVSPVP